MDDDAGEETEISEDPSVNVDPAKIGNASCVTKFVKTLLSLVSIFLFVLYRLFKIRMSGTGIFERSFH